MLLRAVVGACAGAVAGTGFALTLDGLRRYCHFWLSRALCVEPSPLLLPLIIVFWMLVAGVLIYAGFRMSRVARGWWVTGFGSALWVVLAVAAVWFQPLYLDLRQGGAHLFLMAAAVITAGAAYPVAALAVGRARPC